jgi:hypothetical protein
VYRISEEVSPTIESLRLKFRLRDHSQSPEKLDSLFDELFTLIGVRDEDKPRFKASISILMTQSIRDMLGAESNRTRFALVLYGFQGCGKSTFNATLCTVMIGKDINIQKNSLYSSFDNEEILNPVFRVEDLDYNFREIIDKIKTYITSITESSVNIKYKPQKTVIIRTTPLMDTNYDFINIIKTDGEQRRFCIFELSQVTRTDHFEEKLFDTLTRIFKCHTTEYYYDTVELMEENLRLTDVQGELIDYIKNSLYRGYGEFVIGDIDWSTEKFSERKLKQEIIKIMTSFDPNETFLPDNLWLKISKLFFKQWSPHKKTYLYALKDPNSYAGKAGNAGSSKNPNGDSGFQKFLKRPALPALPACLLKDNKIGLNPTLEFEEVLKSYRDHYIYNVIIKHNRCRFYDEPRNEVKLLESNVKEFFDTSTLIKSEISVIYVNYESRLNHFTTKFPTLIPLRRLKDFVNAIEFDNIGGFFEGGVAKNENFKSTNILLIDIDSHNGEDLSNINNINNLGLEYFRVHSKSGEGYHFYFPLSHEVKTKEIFDSVINHLFNTLEEIGVHPDKACRNPSRKFFGTPHTESAFYQPGEKFNVIKALSIKYQISEDENHDSKINPLPRLGAHMVRGTLGKEYRGSENKVKNESFGKSSDFRTEIHQEKGEHNSKIRVHLRYRNNYNFEAMGKSENNSLTDQYFCGNVNAHQVVEDLPHIINYLLTLKEHDKRFYSSITKKYYEIDDAIDEIKNAVSYDPTHVAFIDTIIENNKR